MNQLEVQRYADIPTEVFQDLEDMLLANIIRHCKDWKQPIASDEWLMKKLAEIGRLNQENIRIIARMTGLSQITMEHMLGEVAERIIDEIEPAMQMVARAGLADEAVPVEQSRNVKQVLTTMRKQAKDTMNLCNTTMLYKARDAYQKFVQNMASTADEIAKKQEYIDILNKHTTSAVIGAESRQQALEKCIKEFNERGIPAFVDKRGREWTPEAYVNMAMRSTSNTMAAEIQMARADDFDIDLVEVDSHSGARPKCARDQGKIFDRANKSDKYPHWNTSSYGEPDGLLGINCGHHIWPYIEGVSIRRYFPTEDMEANDKLYKETQVQRALERDVRKQKRECMLFDQAGDKEGFEKAAVKLKTQEEKLQEYINSKTDLHRRKDREQVVGFDKRISTKATNAVTRAKDIRYKGIPKTWERMERKESNSLKKVNPKYNPLQSYNKEQGYNSNCANCVVAYEMRRRGYKVTAGPAIKKLQQNPQLAWKNPEIFHVGEDAKAEIEKALTDAGQGARIQICGTWDSLGNVGHTFVAEQRKNQTIYLDPQSGKEYTENVTSQMKDVQYWRIDNLEISDRGATSCEKE